MVYIKNKISKMFEEREIGQNSISLFLFIIALMIMTLTILLKKATGPYWMGPNSDPSYLYLINSLYILDNYTPYFTDHPGTTLQLLGAVVIKALNLNFNPQNIASRVFRNPEYYLNALHYVMLFLYLGSLIMAGLYAFKKTKSVIFTLATQTSSFLFLTLKSYGSGDYILPVIVNINSDTLIMTVTNFYLICVIKLFYDSKQKDIYVSAVLFGLICGLGLATKFTFLSLLLLPIILLPGYQSRMLFIGTVLASWLVFIFPVISRYREIYDWLKPIVKLSSGGGGGMDISQYGYNLIGAMADQKFFIVFIIICFSASLYKRQRHKEGDRAIGHQRAKTVLLALSIVAICHFMIVAKHPGPHYMAPALGLFGLMLGMLYLCAAINRQRKYIWSLFTLFFLITMLTANALLYQNHLNKTNKDIFHFSNKVYDKYNHCAVFGYYRSSSLPMAIRFAEGHGNLKIYAQQLREMYPDSLFYNPWHRTFHNFEKNVFLEKILKDKDCALLYGSPMDFSQGFINVEEIESVQNERLYKIVSTTLDDAHKHYLISKALESKKEYGTAYGHAVKAKSQGRPGLDGYIEELKKQYSNQR
jgi:hypothetical protein